MGTVDLFDDVKSNIERKRESGIGRAKERKNNVMRNLIIIF